LSGPFVLSTVLTQTVGTRWKDRVFHPVEVAGCHPRLAGADWVPL